MHSQSETKLTNRILIGLPLVFCSLTGGVLNLVTCAVVDGRG